jgi:hypothetical protein
VKPRTRTARARAGRCFCGSGELVAAGAIVYRSAVRLTRLAPLPSLLAIASLLACAGEPVPVSRAPDDPSNPRAAEVPYVPPPPAPSEAPSAAPATAPSETPAPPPDAGAPAHHHHPGIPGMPGM